MNFRDFINTHLFNIIQYKNKSSSGKLKQEIFFFQIGCFPSCINNMNHEYPNFINTCIQNNMNVNLILIDPNYKNFLENNEIRDRINNYSTPTFVYEKYLSESEFTTLVEFCHFISNFDCISIIMDFSGLQRKQFYQNENHTKYLYLTESNCMADTNNILYNPFLVAEEKETINNNNIETYHRYYFLSFENNDHIYESLDYNNEHKVKYLGAYVERQILLAENLYCKILSYLYIKPPDASKDLELNFNKNYQKFHQIIRGLEHRMVADKHRLDTVLDEFFQSEYYNLEVFIKKKICYIFINYLYFKCRSNLELIQLYSPNILFDTLQDARNVIKFLKHDFCC